VAHESLTYLYAVVTVSHTFYSCYSYIVLSDEGACLAPYLIRVDKVEDKPCQIAHYI
jgi:hypothetical protein